MRTDTTDPATDPRPTRTPPIGTRIVEAVATRSGTDPLALEPPLYRVVDTDALERLLESGFGGDVTFEYAGHTVLVSDDGSVTAC